MNVLLTVLNFHAGEGIVYFNLFNSFTMPADAPPLYLRVLFVYFLTLNGW